MEIGSHFSLSYNHKYYDNFQDYYLLNSGRACLKYINDILPKDKAVLLPTYLCESMMEPFTNQLFYDISEKLEIDCDTIYNADTNNISAILIVHYFGRPDPNIEEIVTFCKSKNIIIIEDVTHSYLDTDLKHYGDIVFSSIRKTLSILDGGILKIYNPELNKKIQINHNPYNFNYIKFLYCRLLGMFLKSYKIPHKFLQVLYKYCWRKVLLCAEKLLENNNFNNKMSRISQHMVKHMDLDEIKNIRKNNYMILQKGLKEHAFYPNHVLTFGFPLIFESKLIRDLYLKKFIQNGIYPAIHWKTPEKLEKITDIKLPGLIMSVPIDQRYTKRDMQRIIDIFHK